jgi:hypothetical protein
MLNVFSWYMHIPQFGWPDFSSEHSWVASAYGHDREDESWLGNGQGGGTLTIGVHPNESKLDDDGLPVEQQELELESWIDEDEAGVEDIVLGNCGDWCMAVLGWSAGGVVVDILGAAGIVGCGRVLTGNCTGGLLRRNRETDRDKHRPRNERANRKERRQ